MSKRWWAEAAGGSWESMGQLPPWPQAGRSEIARDPGASAPRPGARAAAAKGTFVPVYRGSTPLQFVPLDLGGPWRKGKSNKTKQKGKPRRTTTPPPPQIITPPAQSGLLDAGHKDCSPDPPPEYSSAEERNPSGGPGFIYL